MKNFALGLFLGIILGSAAAWNYLTPAQAIPSTATVQKAAETAAKSVERGTGAAVDQLAAQLEAYHLTTQEIRDDLSQSGKIVRRSAMELGSKLKDVATDARITASIKAQYARDPKVSVWDISVSTTEGVVTLSGEVDSPDLVGKAMLYALRTEGVDRVISALQVRQVRAESK